MRVRLRSAITTLVVLAFAVGCSGEPTDGGASCTDDASSRAFSLSGACIRLTAARVLSAGSWKSLALDDVSVRAVDADAIALSAVATAPAEAFELTLRAAHGSAMLQQGYQSWSFSGATQIPADVPRAPDGALAASAAASGNPLDEALGVSYGAAVVGDPGGRALAIGATSSAEATTAIAATGPGAPTLAVLYGATREPLPASSGKVTMSEIVIAGADRANDALATLASEIGAALPSTARAPARPPGGWYSWNELFDEVTEADIAAHADIVASELAPEGLLLLEIDDGWEVAWGDWRENAKFPSGMAGVAQAIEAKGLKPGVWLAPFLVDVTSEVAKSADPALFVQGPGGKPLEHQPSGNAKHFYVLDGTNPDSMKLVTEPVAALAAAGYGFFKLDFLYAGALPGVREDATATGVQALQQGLAALRTAMGEGAVLNACGAPIFPLLGHADSMRIGADTAFSAVSLNWADVVFAARSTAARSFLGGLVWLDGDQTQVRLPYTEGEARVSAYVAALSGPAYALGDDLRTLPPERLAIALAPEVLDLAGADSPAVPNDPLEEPAEKIYSSPVLDALANPGSTGAPPPTAWTMRGRSGARYALSFDWTDGHTVSVTKQ